MGSHSFGKMFKFTTWGESHGKAIGVVIDGCPAGLLLTREEIDEALKKRAPGRSPYTSPRQESDQVEILSGLFEGKTTGAPLSLLIENQGGQSKPYEETKHLLKPGHAQYTYLEKYGLFDYRGGGRASGRETAARVAAGAVAKKFLAEYKIEVLAYIKQIGPIEIASPPLENLRSNIDESPLFCPDPKASEKMADLIEEVKKEGDSLGGIIEFLALFAPPGLGDPVYEKLSATLAYALMSIPAAKGFELGSGFASALERGSSHNDPFIKEEGKIVTKTNHAGGILGGISTGMPIVGRVAFKPTSSIKLSQETLNLEGERALFTLPKESKHDPCLAIRAVPVVEAMVALVLADALLCNRCVRK